MNGDSKLKREYLAMPDEFLSIESTRRDEDENMTRRISTVCIFAFTLMAATHARAVDPGLAPPPPMGWNSWNCFENKIDEKKIQAIAYAMVLSGMREAGYV